MSGSREKQVDPPFEPDQGFDDQTADGVAALRRRSQRNRQSQPESGDVEPVEQSPTMQPAKRTKREKLSTDRAPVETPVPKASGSIAEDTLVGPLRESIEREKIKSAAHKAALLNPPRQQEPAQPELDPAADPAKRAELYNTAVLKMQSTLDSLQHRMKRYNSSVSVDDLEVLYNQFGEFMYCHPIFSPAAQREAAAKTGMPVPPYVVGPYRGLSGAGAAPLKKRRGPKPKSRPAVIPPVPRFAEPMPRPPVQASPAAPAWQSMHSSQATEIAVPLQYSYDPSTEPYVYNYQPEPAYAEGMPAAAQPWPDQTDSQAIAQVAQAMEGNQDVVQGGLDGETALQLLQVLSHYAQARVESQSEPQAEPCLPYTDRFAASTLMTLSNRTPNEQQQQQQQYEQQQPAPPSINSSDPRLLSLLMQILQEESGGAIQGLWDNILLQGERDGN